MSIESGSSFAPPEATKSEIVEDKDYIDAGKKLRVGDSVIILRSGGEIEKDWTLKHFGGRFAVVEKVDVADGALLKKVIPVEELAAWQISLQEVEEPYAALDEGAGGNKGRIDSRTPEGKIEADKQANNMARVFNIDTSKPDWRKELDRKIREVSER